MYLNLQLPSAASTQRTEATAHEIEELLARTPGVESTTSIIGLGREESIAVSLVHQVLRAAS